MRFIHTKENQSQVERSLNTEQPFQNLRQISTIYVTHSVYTHIMDIYQQTFDGDVRNKSLAVIDLRVIYSWLGIPS